MRDLTSQPGIAPILPALEIKVVTIGLTGRSQDMYFKRQVYIPCIRYGQFIPVGRGTRTELVFALSPTLSQAHLYFDLEQLGFRGVTT